MELSEAPNNQKKEETQNEINNNNKNNEEKEEEYEILPSDYVKSDYNYKIIVIGDSGVGKTSLTFRATKNEFLDKMNPTLGFEYFPFILRYKEKVIRLEIWDTCGQEAFRALIKQFFNNASLAIIVYAIDDIKSFDSIEQWIRQCKSLCSPDTKFILIVNKSDISEDQ